MSKTTTSDPFRGFIEQTPQFFKELTLNNNKTWFEEHKSDYETFVVHPMRLLVMELGERLKAKVPKIIADPGYNRSIFRIYNDVRFGKDKNPYKTHAAFLLWEGTKPKMECPGFYCHFEANSILIGSGIYMFTKDALAAYRKTMEDQKKVRSLLKAIDHAKAFPEVSIAGKHFKKIPNGYHPVEEAQELILYNGLTTMIEIEIPDWFYTRELLDRLVERYDAMIPLHQWLISLNNFSID